MLDRNFFFESGDVIKIFYFLTSNKIRKMFTFIGLCTNFNLKKKSFTLKNYYRKEYMTLSFLSNAPNIVAIDMLSSYDLKFKKSKLVCAKKYRLSSKTDIFSIKRDIFRKDVIPYLFKVRDNKPRERKRLRSKFRL